MEKVTIDVPMPIHYIRKDLVQELSLLEPFGKGNEKPLFAQKNLWVSQMRVFGKNRNVVKMRLTDENGYPMDGVCLLYTSCAIMIKAAMAEEEV